MTYTTCKIAYTFDGVQHEYENNEQMAASFLETNTKAYGDRFKVLSVEHIEHEVR